MKIFVTVGTMLPFDRLVQAMDRWAGEHRSADVFAQVGDTSLRPKNMPFSSMLTPLEYQRHCSEAEVIVSHAGMGTVMTALELGKRLVALPRKVELREVTSAHQAAAARWLAGRQGVRVATSEDDLDQAIMDVLADDRPLGAESESADRLVARVRSFILGAQ